MISLYTNVPILRYQLTVTNIIHSICSHIPPHINPPLNHPHHCSALIICSTKLYCLNNRSSSSSMYLLRYMCVLSGINSLSPFRLRTSLSPMKTKQQSNTQHKYAINIPLNVDTLNGRYLASALPMGNKCSRHTVLN